MKRAIAFGCWFLVVIFMSASAFAWGSATHAYFAKELGEKWGYLNLQEIYGSMLPDMFNLMYGSPYKDYLWHETHYEFGRVVDRARGRGLRAFAFGFASHNDAWGADYTAHHNAQATEEFPEKGYIIAKREELAPALVPKVKDFLVNSGVPPDVAQALAEELAPGLAENFVETAVDLLIKRNEDPAVGLRILLSAQLRSFGVPFLLNKAYAREFAEEFNLPHREASKIIIGAERNFRELMKFYGGVLIKRESEAIDLLSVQGATLAESFLQTATGYGVTVPPESIAVILRGYAIPLVEADYAEEVSATLAYLEEQMAKREISGASSPFVFRNDTQPETKAKAGQVGFRLEQNRPNPFNPTTTIGYFLPQGDHVNIAVYNSLGQEVDVLVDADQPRGYHNVTWNGSGLASGVYFYRIETGDFKASKRMFLLK